MRNIFTLGCAVATLSISTACSGSLRDSDIQTASAAVPQTFSLTGTEVITDGRWWLQYNDPQLTILINDALNNAPNMHAAWARVEQAAAAAQMNSASLMPSLSANANISSNQQTNASTTTTSEIYSLGLAASYELDLWGNTRGRSDAAQLDALASREDAETTALSLSAQIAETWWRLQTQAAIQKNIQEQLQSQQEICDLVLRQQQNGASTAADLATQQQALAALKSQQALAAAAYENFRLQIQLLRGAASQEALPHIDTLLPAAIATPATGLPIEVLGQRPDVRAALTRVHGADKRVAAAKADRLPKLTLSGSAGFQSSTATALFDNWFTNLAAGLLAPLFDGGRLQAEQRRTEAIVHERLALYKHAVLTAITEVENALHQEQAAAIAYAQACTQTQLATERLTHMHTRYRNAGLSLLSLKHEQLAMLRQQRSELEAQRSHLLQQLALHRALGGRWTTQLSALRTTQEGL